MEKYKDFLNCFKIPNNETKRLRLSEDTGGIITEFDGLLGELCFGADGWLAVVAVPLLEPATGSGSSTLWSRGIV